MEIDEEKKKCVFTLFFSINDKSLHKSERTCDHRSLYEKKKRKRGRREETGKEKNNKKKKREKKK